MYTELEHVMLAACLFRSWPRQHNKLDATEVATGCWLLVAAIRGMWIYMTMHYTQGCLHTCKPPVLGLSCCVFELCTVKDFTSLHKLCNAQTCRGLTYRVKGDTVASASNAINHHMCSYVSVLYGARDSLHK